MCLTWIKRTWLIDWLTSSMTVTCLDAVCFLHRFLLVIRSYIHRSSFKNSYQHQKYRKICNYISEQKIMQYLIRSDIRLLQREVENSRCIERPYVVHTAYTSLSSISLTNYKKCNRVNIAILNIAEIVSNCC